MTRTDEELDAYLRKHSRKIGNGGNAEFRAGYRLGQQDNKKTSRKKEIAERPAGITR